MSQLEQWSRRERWPICQTVAWAMPVGDPSTTTDAPRPSLKGGQPGCLMKKKPGIGCLGRLGCALRPCGTISALPSSDRC